MIKAVIFDFGGVIKKSDESCFNNIAKAYNLPKDKVWKKMKPHLDAFYKGAINEKRFWKDLSSDLKKPIPENSKDLWRKDYKNNFFIYDSIMKLEKKLEKKKIKTAVLSNTIVPHVEIIGRKEKYREFDVVILSCEVGLKKPDPEIYLLAINKLGVKPEECIFIDDKKENLKPAKEMGIKTVLAKNPKQVTREVLSFID